MGPFRDRKRWRSAKPKVERDRSTGNPAAFALLRALVILMFGALILQLINLQVIRGDEFKQRAEINALREVPLPAARGLILDRNGQPLVQNSAQFSAAIVPGDLPERGETAVYRLVSGVVGIPAAEVEAKVREGVKNQGEYSPAVIKQDIDRDAALQLLELVPHAPGLQVIVEPSRRYLTGSLLSHVLGYVGPISAEEYDALSEEGYLLQDFLGKTGVESTYEGVLRGKPGKKLVEVDSAGRELKVISERKPIDGSNLVLSIDLDLQRKTAEVLNEFAVGSENAAAAVMDVKTGELLSMVSLPTFDSNAFSGPIDRPGPRGARRFPGQAPRQPPDRRALPTGQHLQDDSRRRRSSRGRGRPVDDDHQPRLYHRRERVRPECRVRLPRLGPSGCARLLRWRRYVLQRLFLLPRRAESPTKGSTGSARPKSPTTRGPSVLASPQASIYPANLQDSSRTPLGRNRRSANHGRSATPITSASARGTSRQRLCRCSALLPR